MKRIVTLLSLPLLLALVSFFAVDDAAKKADAEAITKVVTEYARAFYDVKPELLETSLHKDLAKYGFYRPAGAKDYRGMPMSYDQALALAADLNKEGILGENLTQKVTILDQMDMTAAVKLEAIWGIDYIHVAKYDGKWKMLQVIWQSRPE
ncbi:MAG: hypothetical protein ACI9F9_002237 [Candidatus Paceibacteria bacterium]|jgi:hypothetical protein